MPMTRHATRDIDTAALIRIRNDAGLTQTELAKALSIVPNYLSNIEGGRRQPSAKIVKRLADQLGVSVEDITYLREPEAVAS